MAGQEHGQERGHEHDRECVDGAPRDDGDACRIIVLPEECRDPATPGEDAEFAHPADVADHLENLSLERQVCVLRHLPAEDAADALAELDEHVRVDLLENLDADVAAQILSEMSPDDAADVLDELDEDHRDVLLSSLETEDAEEIRHLMAFDPDTAGGVMNTEVIILDHGLTADQAILQIRAEIEDKEIPYYAYVVDEQDRLVGVLSLRDIMLCKPGNKLRDEVRGQGLISVLFDQDKEEVAHLLGHYNFMAMPVVDYEGRLLGVVTHDDIIDIIHDEASEDMLGMVGAGTDETVDTPWHESVLKRLPWLVINMLNSAVSASVVYMFEGSIAQMAVLAVLMPMVANQAGNTGQQALAVMIRQLAVERFDRRKAWWAVLREAKIGLSSGAIVALLVLCAVWAFAGSWKLASVMSLALLLDMLLGALAGASIPLILRAVGRDPAQASSIFLTAITDGAGFFIFLGLATLVLF
ncbi:magnesium transporter [Desulfovibrio oxamicus]|uniref:Magnesium transporter MgtE n=1 Tax=Nitratidesulfovibrio oxamicus TaxID=32016 RepID=A0ABS0J7D1_9BACT|nr:magnesium transporter [Nitratidesulfovibrio oxamicus]MBG3878365.1 magnesium transporter [Nitratidesulfovibrio oxamicus]